MKKTTKAWEEIFQTQGNVFTNTHEDIATVVRALKKEGAHKILDLGCGSGRHTIYFVKMERSELDKVASEVKTHL